MISLKELGKLRPELLKYTDTALYINKVKLYRKQMKLLIEFQYDDKQDKEIIEKIKSELKLYFPKFKVEFNDKVLKTKDESIEKQILKIIKDYVPSSVAWIDELKIIVKDKTIQIECPDEMINYSLTNNGLRDELKRVCDPNNEYHFIICNNESCKISKANHEDVENFYDQLDSQEHALSKESIIKSNSDKKRFKDETIKNDNNQYIYGSKKFTEIVPLNKALIGSDNTFEVEIFDMEINKKFKKKNRTLMLLYCTDNTDSRIAKVFIDNKDLDEFEKQFSVGDNVLIYGKYIYDSYDNDKTIIVKNMKKQKKKVRMDTSDKKRIELHLHSQMSNMDGVTSISDYIDRAALWNHDAIAVTDHQVVQAFPEAMNAAKKNKIKMIYGMEADIVDDRTQIVKGLEKSKNYESYVVFDLETTGFSPINDKIIEIGAVKIVNGTITDSFGKFVNPGRQIPDRVVELTSITDEMVSDADSIDIVMEQFKSFVGNSILVAHNASFDAGFIAANNSDDKGVCPYPIVDTLSLSQCLVTDIKNYKLGTLVKKYGIKLANAHRAVDDARATAELFLILMNIADKAGISNLEDYNTLVYPHPEKLFPFHLTILVQNKKGLYNLYKLVSESHIKSFYRTPRIKYSSLIKNREGLIFGSSCLNGKLFDRLIRGASYRELLDIAQFYDFLEVQIPEAYESLIYNHYAIDQKQIQEYIKVIIKIGEELNIPVVATGDVHYLDPSDEIYYKILKHATYSGRNKSIKNAYYFHTTDEMLKKFNFLGTEKANEIVIENTHLINSWIEEFDAIPSEKYPPKIKNATEELKKGAIGKAISIYGDPLPKIVKDRLDKELKSIIENGYSVMYIIAQQLVKKSNEDGYYVGSRGSVGSSFVATMLDITEVNPLVPHYVCPNCKYTEFIEDGSYASGVDLPPKKCPCCNTELNRDGHTIPFEVFLGFYGDKEPDIDLNFAGEYQPKAHQFVEDFFGDEYVFRAGTIGTLAKKTAFGLVKKYCEDNDLYYPPIELKRLATGCVGVKRTSGQHPGGIMIVPKDNDILNFTPVQYPANDKSKNVITTHFDYEAISKSILKLDILGHDAPSILKMLEDFTGVSIDEIPLDDPEVMSLFLSADALKLNRDIFDTSTGTLGIPEFGTDFVIKMLNETNPKTFSELVNISGLSHGTQVWKDNAQDLVKEGKATISNVISTREDIMNYLIQAGAENKMAFDTMEAVRKGKGIPKEYEEQIYSLDLPSWYIDSCLKIKYMFPKAHAVAYVMTSIRIAWYKIHYPEAFYATYFTTKLLDFNGQLMIQGKDKVAKMIKILDEKNDHLTTKEKSEKNVLQIALEMFARGYKFKPVDLYKSSPNQFLVDDDKGIILPLQSLPNVGESIALEISKEAKKKPFLSIEDLIRRTGASKSVIEALEIHGTLDHIPKSDQLNLLDFL